MATLKINGLSKAFGINTVFENVTFDVKSGERIGLVGANGADPDSGISDAVPRWSWSRR